MLPSNSSFSPTWTRLSLQQAGPTDHKEYRIGLVISVFSGDEHPTVELFRNFSHVCMLHGRLPILPALLIRFSSNDSVMVATARHTIETLKCVVLINWEAWGIDRSILELRQRG